MINSDISKLGKYSNELIHLICDSCSIEKYIKYKLYTSYGYSDGEYLCRSCKMKKNNLEKWGVENVFQVKEVKEKIKKTNLKKYNVENVSQSKHVKDKIKKAKSKLNKEEINNKRKNTVLSKYNVENISQLNEIKEKVISTNFKKYGINHNKKNESFRKKYFRIANDFNYVIYKNKGLSLFRCDLDKDHLFDINIDIYHKRKEYNTILCTICNPVDKNQSGKEIMVYNFIRRIYNGEIIQNYKIERKEIDIFLPEYSLGFEFNGIYWHSELFKEKDYHLKKTNFFSSKGIRLFHIWEDDWDNRNEVIKSQISNILKLNSNKIWARNCDIREVKDIKQIRFFLNENHIQGYVNSIIKIGLYYNNELVSLMIFDHFEGRKKMLDKEWNLSRFCSKLNLNVAGGASKLLSFFVRNYSPNRIISYADRSWSNGDLYERLNFNKTKSTKQDYKYVLDGKRIHKSNFKKSLLNISETKLDIFKIWDCGKIKYEIIF